MAAVALLRHPGAAIRPRMSGMSARCPPSGGATQLHLLADEQSVPDDGSLTAALLAIRVDRAPALLSCRTRESPGRSPALQEPDRWSALGDERRDRFEEKHRGNRDAYDGRPKAPRLSLPPGTQAVDPGNDPGRNEQERGGDAHCGPETYRRGLISASRVTQCSDHNFAEHCRHDEQHRNQHDRDPRQLVLVVAALVVMLPTRVGPRKP